MPDEILLMILSLMPLKDAVATGILSKRWISVWCNLIHLSIDGGERLDKIVMIPMLRDQVRSMYIKKVNSIIKHHNAPLLQEFRICFDLDCRNKHAIDYWLHFAMKKKVQTLELDFMYHLKYRMSDEYYDFPLHFLTKNARIFLKLHYLRKLVLKGVNVREAILQNILRTSPHLETLFAHNSGFMAHVLVGGKALKLKHFEIKGCSNIRSIYLYEFDLVSFTYKGPAIDLRLGHLPKMKELDICQGAEGLQNNIFRQIASCVSYIQVLSLNILQTERLMLNSIPELPNVKKLRLTIGAYNDKCLLRFTYIANACLSLETFTIQLLWGSPIWRKRKARHFSTPTRPYNNLCLLELMGYYGRMSDFELVAHIIENAVALKQIVIDPRCQGRIGNTPLLKLKKNLKIEETARTYAHSQLKSITPQGVKLLIL
ncbi:F-box/LRR-repeat protein At3g58900 [Lactuca sativa]|nr:F-box/LRR-repeat protein At3g58900 [Lactuca sativa]